MTFITCEKNANVFRAYHRNLLNGCLIAFANSVSTFIDKLTFLASKESEKLGKKDIILVKRFVTFDI